MFYAVENDNALRFGDVIKGFVLAVGLWAVEAGTGNGR